MITEENDKIIQQVKLEINHYFKNGDMIHIKTHRGFYNGFIKEIRPDFITFTDRKLGSVPVFFVSIVSISKFQTKEEIRSDEKK